MVRRHARSPVAPSAYVFPGGTIRADDLEFEPELDREGLAQAIAVRADTPVEPTQAAAFYVSALRELFEEAGVLLARDAAGGVLNASDSDTSLKERLESTRLALQAQRLSLARVFADWGWQPAFDLLVPFSHWVTPRLLAVRFDTRFFVAEMPPAQAALHDTIETSEGVWLSPAQARAGAFETLGQIGEARRTSGAGALADRPLGDLDVNGVQLPELLGDVHQRLGHTVERASRRGIAVRLLQRQGAGLHRRPECHKDGADRTAAQAQRLLDLAELRGLRSARRPEVRSKGEKAAR